MNPTIPSNPRAKDQNPYTPWQRKCTVHTVNEVLLAVSTIQISDSQRESAISKT